MCPIDEAFVRFVFFPVGRGSCTLVSFPPEREGSPRRYGVVDCNQSDARSVKDYLQHPFFPDEPPPEDPTRLRFVALTHYDYDHFNGVDVLVGGGGSPFRPDYFFYPLWPPAAVRRKYPNVSSLPRRQLTEIDRVVFEPRRNGTYDRSPKPRSLNFDASYEGILFPDEPLVAGSPLRIRALAPSSRAVNPRDHSLAAATDANFSSAALRIQFGKSVVILAGDVQEDEWHQVRADYEYQDGGRPRLGDLAAGVMLVPHHGGRGNPELLWEVSSRKSAFHQQKLKYYERRLVCERDSTLAVISCGKGDNNLPSRDTLDRLKRHRAAIRCTTPNQVCRELSAECNRPIPCVAQLEEKNAPSRVLPKALTPRDAPSLHSQIRLGWSETKAAVCVDIFPSGKRRYHFDPRACFWNDSWTEPARQCDWKLS